MADRHRSFEVGIQGADPITFDMGGETFHIIAEMPVKMLAEIGTDSRQGLEWGLHFMRNVIVRDDRDRFEALLDDPDRPVAAPVFTSLCTWVLEQLTGNPTEPSSLSPGGSGTTGETSTALSVVQA